MAAQADSQRLTGFIALPTFQWMNWRRVFMTSPQSALIREVSRSWLYFLQTSLAAQAIPCVSQAGDTRAFAELPQTGLNAYVVVGPASEWRVTEDGLEVAFRIRTVSRQRNGDGLAAYEANLSLQLAVNEILWHRDRLVSGFSTGREPLYGLPLWTFDSEAVPLQQVDAHALVYSSQPHWISRTALEADQVVWTLDLTLQAYGL
jgi:hypothetical protein